VWSPSSVSVVDSSAVAVVEVKICKGGVRAPKLSAKDLKRLRDCGRGSEETATACTASKRHTATGKQNQVLVAAVNRHMPATPSRCCRRR
jgi:hypothetical protein